ncbi:MAG: hypothetical protein ACKOXB_10215 [Flavobacteriales bacterium]
MLSTSKDYDPITWSNTIERLPTGLAAEKTVCDYLTTKKGYYCQQIKGKHAPYDLLLTYTADTLNPTSTMEVKADFRNEGTGNYFIEKEQNGYPSGIEISKAKYWCIVSPSGHTSEFHKAYVIEAKDIKRLIKENNYNIKWGHQSRGYIIPKSHLTPIAEYLIPTSKNHIPPYPINNKK